MHAAQLKPKEFEVGDYVSYEYKPKSDKKSGKGFITQITNHCLFIHPDNAHYKGEVEGISFSELYTKEVKVNLVHANQDIYYEV